MDVNKATVPVKEDESILSIPWDLLPSAPDWLAEVVVDLRSAPVPPIRALTFFTNTALNQGSASYKKWNKALQFELAIHVIATHYAAWARPVLDQPRLWYPSYAHVQWLKKFIDLPPVPIFFETLGKYVNVSVRDVVKILEDARARAIPIKRRDYCTKTNVEFVVTPNSHVYVNDPLREIVTRDATPTSNPVPLRTQPSAAISGKIGTTSNKPISSTGLAGRGGVLAKVYKRDQVRKQTDMTDEMFEGMKGVGLCSLAEVVNYLVNRVQTIAKSNESSMAEVSQLQEENRRLRDDIQRYRDDATRIGSELRSLRDPYNPYDSGRSGASRGWSDPYERGYGYDRRY